MGRAQQWRWSTSVGPWLISWAKTPTGTCLCMYLLCGTASCICRESEPRKNPGNRLGGPRPLYPPDMVPSICSSVKELKYRHNLQMEVPHFSSQPPEFSQRGIETFPTRCWGILDFRRIISSTEFVTCCDFNCCATCFLVLQEFSTLSVLDAGRNEKARVNLARPEPKLLTSVLFVALIRNLTSVLEFLTDCGRLI